MKKLLPVSFVILIGVILFTPVIPVLAVYNRKNPSEVFYSAKGYKNGFVISYTHSVNKGRVHDYYRRTTKNELELYQTQFVSYGAGIPEPEETPGAVFTVTDTGYFISELNRVVPQLMMAVGIIANHSITFEGKEYFLTDYFAPQTSLFLKFKRVSLVTYKTKTFR